MKSNLKLAALSLALCACAAAPAAAQDKSKSAGQKKEQQKGRQKEAPRPSTPKPEAGERLEPDDTTVVRPDVPEAAAANRREQVEEDAQSEVPYYNNFLTSYRLGPEDVISVKVFGLERYDKANITVPPDGRIDYYFIKDGLHVVGKTTRQVAEEITRHLDEYIIDPKVTVSLEKGMSARYGVLGDVAKPGVYVMARRMSVAEALYDAGGVLNTGNKSKVVVLRWNADRMMERVLIDVAAIEKGRMPDNYFLRPGDQIFVPGNRFKTVKEILNILPVINFARIFTGGF
jgi:polysaccharide export outer membrane protein